MSDSNPIAVLERTSLIVYDPDIFNCSRQTAAGIVRPLGVGTPDANDFFVSSSQSHGREYLPGFRLF